ncbi:major facilitator superfamily domain-containing protein [Chytriomyces sp. MP71]|nr:major facilitator superfamily domain-containing protein [Chytriomyces sp. MP71]
MFTRGFLLRMATVLLCVMPEVAIYHLLHPLYPYIASTLSGEAGGQGHGTIATRTGLLSSAYFLPSIVSAPLLGAVSDRLGRKKVLVAGLAGYGLGALLLGIATRFSHALTAMFVMGFFSGNATVAKGLIGDLATDDTSRAAGYSAYGIAYAICSIAGTVVGAFLSKSSLLADWDYVKRHPYFVPSAFGFLLAYSCLAVVSLFLNDENETPSKPPSYASLKDKSHSSDLKIRLAKDSLYSPSSSTDTFYTHLAPYLAVLNRHTVGPLTLYTLYALTSSLLHTAIALTIATAHQLPQQRSAQLAAHTALAKLAAKLLYLAAHARAPFGSLGMYRLGTLLLVPGVLWVGGGALGFLEVGMVAVGVGESWAYLSLIMLITEGAQAFSESSGGSGGSGTGGKAALGLVHGVSGCLAAIVRTAGPAIAGMLWEASGGGFALFCGIGGVVAAQLVLSVLMLRRRRFRASVTSSDLVTVKRDGALMPPEVE